MLQFSLLEESTHTLSKVIINNNGNLIKEAPLPISSGSLHLTQVQDILEFKTYLEKIKPAQAFIYGIDYQARKLVRVTTKKKYEFLQNKDNFICRSKEFLQWPLGPGILFLDIDEYTGDAYTALKLLFPQIEEIKILQCYSSSGNLWLNNKKLFESNNKLRFYIPLKNICDVDRLTEILKVRSWMSGLGFYKFSKSFDLLQRYFIDISVLNYWSLDFVAPTEIKDPFGALEWRGKEIKVLGKTLNFYDSEKLIGNLSTVEIQNFQSKQYTDKLKKEKQRKSTSEYARYIEHEQVRLGLKSLNHTQKVIEARYRSVIQASDIVEFDDGKKVRILEILLFPDIYANKSMRDPLEPSYGINKAYLYINEITNRPMIHSFAHGDRTYEIKYDAFSLQKIIENKGTNYITENFPKMVMISDVTPIEIDQLLELIKRVHGISKTILINTIKNEAKIHKEKLEDEIEMDVCDEYNKKFGAILHGSKFKIYKHRAYNPMNLNSPYIFLEPRDFLWMQAHDKIRREYAGQRIVLKKADIWLQSGNKALYDEIVFDPTITGNFEKHGKRILNEFTGFAVNPIKKDSHKDILEIIYELWDDTDANLFEYDMSILKTMVQNPGSKAAIYRILSGLQGSGKSFLFDNVFSKMFSPYYYMINNQYEITGTFTGVWAKRIMLFIEEAAGVYDKQFHNVLKSLISSKVQKYESKFVDAYLGSNYLWVYSATNDEHVNRMSVDSRREFVTYVNSKRVGDADYWSKKIYNIKAEFQTESLMYELKTGEITRDIWNLPRTQSRQENIEFSETPKIEFLIEMINRGKFSTTNLSINEIGKYIPDVSFSEVIQQQQLKDFYVSFCITGRYKYSHPQDTSKRILFKQFKQFFPINSLEYGTFRAAWNKNKLVKGFLLPSKERLKYYLIEEGLADEHHFID